jgi:hypothetical protein
VQKFYPEVTTVKDATEDVDIEVTNRISQSAAVKNHKKCAMSVACERQLGADGAIVSVNVAYLIKGKSAVRYRVPESVSREVVSFDRNGGFAAGSYELKAPLKGHRIGEHYTQSRKNTGKRRRSNKHNHITAEIRTSLLRKESLA